MQLLFEIGEEHGEHRGLGYLKGRVLKFPPGLKVPHMGWNTLQIVFPNIICQNIPNGSYFYFVHSYYAEPEDKDCIAATSEYGLSFPAVVGRDNVWGAQFHPEKSSPWGLTMLENFGKWVVNK
jgi:glutamine amidotransferase